MEIVKQYLAGLEKAYFDNGAKETWEHFEKIKHGQFSKVTRPLMSQA